MKSLIERSKSYDEHKVDFPVSCQQVKYNTDCQMVIPNALFEGGTALNLTDWALTQLCNKLGSPPVRYMRKCPPMLRSINLHFWTQRLEKDWLVRAYDDDARAVLGQDYGIIQNTDVLEMAVELLADTPHRIIRPHLTPDTLHMRFSMSDKGGGGNYAVGTYLGNGEVGNRFARWLPYIQKTSCENSIVYNKAGVVMKHQHTSIEYFKATVIQKTGHVLGFAADMVKRMLDAELERMPRFSEIVAQICKKKGLSQEVLTAIHRGSEGSETRGGLVNGISYAAHYLEDEDRRTDLETLAGAILCEPDSLFGKVLSREYAEMPAR